MSSVAVIGECMMELRHNGGRTLTLGYAGDSANLAVYLARWSAGADRVRFVSLTGDDEYSQALLDSLAAEGVDTEPVVRLPGHSPGLYLVRVDERGERAFTYHRCQSPARELFCGSHAASHAAAVERCEWICLSAITLSLLGAAAHERLVDALDRARAHGARVVFDTNYRPAGWADRELARLRVAEVLARTDVALPTLVDEQALFGDADADACLQRLHAAGVGEVALKRGPDGALVSHAGARSGVPAVPVARVVDTTAAGDAFDAGYLYSRLRGAGPEVAAAHANRLAATVIAHPGAIVPRDATPDPPAISAQQRPSLTTP